jgi:sec-independent protein translocase protein TatB
MQLGFPEMLFIFVLALIIFGPKKLPEIGRQIGKAMAEFKRASNEFKYQLESEMRDLEVQGNAPAGGASAPDGSVAGGIGRAVAEFQRVTGEVKSRFEQGVRDLEADTNAAALPAPEPSVAAPPAPPAEPAPPAKGPDA